MMKKKIRTETLLIIDDEDDIRAFTSNVLLLEGYCVLEALDAEDGIRIAKEKPVDLVLLDLKLPGKDGWTVIKQMKREPKLSIIPVIIFTAHAELSQRDNAFKAGVADYLVKPISAATLRNSVLVTLRQSGERSHGT